MSLRVVSPLDDAPVVLRVALDGFAQGATRVLGAISFQVHQGETVALTGPSGVGKTTLLRIIGGLQGGFAGSCDGPLRIAMVFQEPTLLPWRNLRENIRIPTGVSISEAEAALAEVGLAGRGDDVPRALSLGQQRRLSLARAFAAKPDLLLMDEPFVSLDPELVDEMMRLFAGLRAARNITTIFVTHVRDEAQKLSSRIITLGGTPAQITSDEKNSGAYFQLSAS